jgi:hypothetical protein
MFEIDNEGNFQAEKLLNINKQDLPEQIFETENADIESDEEDYV